ncbi:hypothetical protein AB0D91_46405 [Streptomyces canus]|uniref:hypothetical protein n=1 Tax=Streptomyces canus TaxID=58343 RepID=UPI003411BE69
MARQARGRARIFFSDAAKQIDAITDEFEIHASDDVDDVRVIYFLSALRTVIIVAYVEGHDAQAEAPVSSCIPQSLPASAP